MFAELCPLRPVINREIGSLLRPVDLLGRHWPSSAMEVASAVVNYGEEGRDSFLLSRANTGDKRAL